MKIIVQKGDFKGLVTAVLSVLAEPENFSYELVDDLLLGLKREGEGLYHPVSKEQAINARLLFSQPFGFAFFWPDEKAAWGRKLSVDNLSLSETESAWLRFASHLLFGKTDFTDKELFEKINERGRESLSFLLGKEVESVEELSSLLRTLNENKLIAALAVIKNCILAYEPVYRIGG
ncbi:hypothetical protein B9Q03_13905 [Candidatus Marsarchaeota G2 archaeon OSP_D]|jgi:hypothetical protein|uniref:Uncharacterized protein n=1 Tax=Candidatus Marsarchaeota G2 archaeon OSP_D TaxID=1978157 RepID=A0A2R6A8Z0_9ARCH|nr:MAG: hypothetical protein B9Q03_13905 [Candidatus Marsarchaeota G2 archaeon OSP_D]